MANFKIPTAIGEVSVVKTRNAIVTVTLNPDGKTYEILVDGTLYKASASLEFVTSFVEGMLQDDLDVTQGGSKPESPARRFRP